MSPAFCIAQFNDTQGAARHVFDRAAEETARYYGGEPLQSGPVVVSELGPNICWVSLVQFSGRDSAHLWYEQEVREALRVTCADVCELPNVVLVDKGCNDS